jgi:hypothetical protein
MVHNVLPKQVEQGVEYGRSDAIRRDRRQKGKPEIQNPGKGQIAGEQQDELVRDRIGHARFLQEYEQEDGQVAVSCDVERGFGRH